MPTACCWGGHIPQLALPSPNGWGNSRRSHVFSPRVALILTSKNKGIWGRRGRRSPGCFRARARHTSSRAAAAARPGGAGKKTYKRSIFTLKKILSGEGGGRVCIISGLKKKKKVSGVWEGESPSALPRSPSRGSAPPPTRGQPEVPPAPTPPGGCARPRLGRAAGRLPAGTGTPAELRVCLGLAEPNQGRLPAVFRQGCERRLLSPFYTSAPAAAAGLAVAARPRRTGFTARRGPAPRPHAGHRQQVWPLASPSPTHPFPAPSRRDFPSSSSLFCLSAFGRCGRKAARRRLRLAGGTRGRLCGQISDAGAWSPYLPEPYLAVISREGETYSVPICEGAVCESCVDVPMVIWRAPRWAESGEPRRPLLLLSLLCLPFRFPSLLREAGHRGLCVCLSVCPASLKLVAPQCDRSRHGRRRWGWPRDGCHPPKVCSGSGQAPRQGCRWAPAPAAGTARPARPLPGPLPRCRRAHVGARPVRISRLPFSPPPFRDLGLEISKQARRCAEKLTSLSGEVTLKGSPY